MKYFLLAAAATASLFQTDMEKTLVEVLTLHPYIVYGFIIVLACTEGPILSVMSGTLIRLGYFSFVPIYFSLMIGDLVGDTFWYYVGNRFGTGFIKRFGERVGVTEIKVRKVSKLFHRHTHKILFINKLTMGFGFALATLVTAGIAKIPFRIYIAINSIGQIFWTGFLIALGYFVGQAYTMIDTIFGVFGKIALIALFALIIYALHQYKKYMTRQAELMPV